MMKFHKGDNVEWTWGQHSASGKVSESFTEDVKRTIKGEFIKRKASKAEPAYLVTQSNGATVLKSQSELRKP